MRPKSRLQPENKPSSLLSSEENQQTFSLLGPKCITIATAVVQLYCTKGPHHSYWVKQDTGVFCFVKDNNRKNYFFRMYCLRRNGKIWEHEIYNNMEYKPSAPFLHSFEGDKCIYAFNFACLDEAKQVRLIVTDKLAARQLSAAQKEPQERTVETRRPQVNANKKVQANPQGKKKKHKRRLTKAEIGNPTEFRHITKVKWDFDKGLDVDTSDKVYLEIFKKAGYDEKMLENRQTREFVIDFIENYPSRKEATQSMQNAKPIPTRSAPRPPPNRLPPPPPPREQQQHTKNSKNNDQSSMPPNFAPPPPPPPPRPPSLVPSTGPLSAPPPPPPPPPPQQMESRLPDSNANATSLSEKATSLPEKSTDMRSALLDSIRQGKSLKPVSAEPKSSEPNKSDMLRQIKEGVVLKPPSEFEPKSSTPVPVDDVTDIAMALKKVLESRSIAIRSDDDTDSGTSSDDEWDA